MRTSGGCVAKDLSGCTKEHGRPIHFHGMTDRIIRFLGYSSDEANHVDGEPIRYILCFDWFMAKRKANRPPRLVSIIKELCLSADRQISRIKVHRLVPLERSAGFDAKACDVIIEELNGREFHDDPRRQWVSRLPRLTAGQSSQAFDGTRLIWKWATWETEE